MERRGGRSDQAACRQARIWIDPSHSGCDEPQILVPCSCTLPFLFLIVQWQQSMRQLIHLPEQGCPWQVSVRRVNQGWHLVQSNSTTLRHTHPVGSCLSPAQREAYGADRPFFPQEVEEQLHIVARDETTDCSYVQDALRYVLGG